MELDENLNFKLKSIFKTVVRLDHIDNDNISVKDIQNIQESYNLAFKFSRKIFKTSSPTIALSKTPKPPPLGGGSNK